MNEEFDIKLDCQLYDFTELKKYQYTKKKKLLIRNY